MQYEESSTFGKVHHVTPSAIKVAKSLVGEEIPDRDVNEDGSGQDLNHVERTLCKCNSMLMHFASSAEPFAFEVVHRFPRPGLTGLVVAHIQLSLVNR